MNEEKIAHINEPKDGEHWVMECTLEVQSILGEASQRVKFSGFATSEVVESFLDIARKVAGV